MVIPLLTCIHICHRKARLKTKEFQERESGGDCRNRRSNKCVVNHLNSANCVIKTKHLMLRATGRNSGLQLSLALCCSEIGPDGGFGRNADRHPGAHEPGLPSNFIFHGLSTQRIASSFRACSQGAGEDNAELVKNLGFAYFRYGQFPSLSLEIRIIWKDSSCT